MRVLALNIGNSTVSSGVFFDGRLIRRMRFDLTDASTSTRFRRAIAPYLKGSFDFAAIASVVPKLTPIALSQTKALVGFSPKLLSAAGQHTLRINYREPTKMGSDRVAAALGAHWLYPHQSSIIVDCGTATTATALTKEGTLLGGAIIPGLALWSEILTQRTAQLPRVGPTVSKKILGRSPEEGIAGGIYSGHIGAIREIVSRMKREAFGRGKAVVIGTGGHAEHFALESLFDVIEPDLVLQGLCQFAQSK